MTRASSPRGGAIAMSGLRKSYGRFVAVDDVSLAVKAGEFVTLLGSSGSGKTTTLMMIAGFIDPEAGSISIDGRDILALPPERRNLGVVFQSYALFPHLDAFENIAFPLRLRREPPAQIERKVRDVLALVDLADFGKRRIGQLSGGQQQRVALARAIVFSPPVLLMDEPLGALDRKLRDQLQGEIKRVQRDLGVTVVYVTHDQEEALALSDRIAIMSEGKIVQLGGPDEVYERPVSPFVATFLGESNMLAGRVVGRNGDQVQVALDSGGAVWTGTAREPLADPSVLVMTRPEAVSIETAGAGGNAIPGTVESREFMGATVRLGVRTAAGEMVVRVPRTDARASTSVGETVSLTCPPDHTIIFPSQR